MECVVLMSLCTHVVGGFLLLEFRCIRTLRSTSMQQCSLSAEMSLRTLDQEELVLINLSQDPRLPFKAKGLRCCHLNFEVFNVHKKSFSYER